MSTVSYPHIEERQNGKLYIAGTPFKVRQIALDHVYAIQQHIDIGGTAVEQPDR